MTEAEIRARVNELARLQKNADTMHIQVMHEVGKLVNEVQTLRGYTGRHSAEAEVSRMLKGAGMPRVGEVYIRACWQYAFKLNDTQRKKVVKFQLGVEDIKSLCNMSMGRIDEILGQIRRGELLPAYGKGGMTYHIRSIENPARQGKRRSFRSKLAIGETGNDPGVISARVFRRGVLDAEALEDLFANVYSRVDYDTAERARLAGLRRVGKECVA